MVRSLRLSVGCVLLSGLVGLAGCGGSSSSGLPPPPGPMYGGGDFFQLLRYQDLDRGYTVHVPGTATADTPAPVLIMLHGQGQDAPGLRSLASIETMTDAAGWIVLYPDGIERAWAIGNQSAADLRGVDDVGFIRRMLDRVTADLVIDPERVYVAGLSMGSLMAQRLGCELSTRIRGIVSVAGMMLGRLADRCEPTRPVAALFFHGDEDDFFPWDGHVESDGTIHLGALETVAWWADRNGCAAAVTTALPDIADDGTTVQRYDYASCAGGSRVRFFAITGGGHTWPGRGGIGRTSLDISANAEILDFFEGQP